MNLSLDDFFPIFDIGVLELILEKINEKSSSHVQSLFSIVISIIFVSLAQKGIEESSSHVSDEVSLSFEAFLVSSDMRDYLLHENVFGVLDKSHLIVGINSSQFIDVLSYEM